MAITTATTFVSVHVEFNAFVRYLTGINWRDSSGVNGRLYFDDGTIPTAGETFDTLTILRQIYATHGGFPDDNGDLITIDTNPENVTMGQPGEDWANPFIVASGQSGEDDALTSLGNRYYNLRLWQASATKPADPPSEWWDDDGLVYPLGSWHLTRASAVLNGTAGDPVWFALDALSIGDNSLAYNGWGVFREFGVEYSTDETNWHATQADDDIYFAFITPTGTRKIVEIAQPPDLDWTQLYFGSPYNAGSGVQIEFGSNINFNLYKRLRFTFQPFGYWQSGGDPGNRGAQISTIFPKPHIDGWESSTGANVSSDDDSTGTFTWIFDEITGASVIPHEHGSRDSMDIPSSIVRTGTFNGNGLPARRIAGKGKWGGPNTNTQHIINQLRMYDFGSNSNYERFTLRIEGATY